MRRGEIYWADLGPPAGRRPVIVLTRDPAIPVLSRIVVAMLTRTVRGIATEVPVGAEEGLPEDSVVSCDNLATVPRGSLDREPVGSLAPAKIQQLDSALRYALQIRF